jgi:superfamily II DNA helicase RecQ
MSDDFDFDIGSDDEAEMLAAAAGTSGKRSLDADNNQIASKRAKIGNGPSTVLANRILKERFGLKGFRLEQEAAITRVLDGGSAVVVFPTGGGKSLCYQVSFKDRWTRFD